MNTNHFAFIMINIERFLSRWFIICISDDIWKEKEYISNVHDQLLKPVLPRSFLVLQTLHVMDDTEMISKGNYKPTLPFRYTNRFQTIFWEINHELMSNLSIWLKASTIENGRQESARSSLYSSTLYEHYWRCHLLRSTYFLKFEKRF